MKISRQLLQQQEREDNFYQSQENFQQEDIQSDRNAFESPLQFANNAEPAYQDNAFEQRNKMKYQLNRVKQMQEKQIQSKSRRDKQSKLVYKLKQKINLQTNVDEDQIQHLQQQYHQAAIKIQKVVRGMIVRKKIKSLMNKKKPKQHQKKTKKRKAKETFNSREENKQEQSQSNSLAASLEHKELMIRQNAAAEVIQAYTRKYIIKPKILQKRVLIQNFFRTLRSLKYIFSKELVEKLEENCPQTQLLKQQELLRKQQPKYRINAHDSTEQRYLREIQKNMLMIYLKQWILKKMLDNQ